MKKYVLECCVDSVESAMIATKGGANRLELCSNLIIGGTTPSKGLFLETRKNCSNRIHALIRPRFGDFCYSDYEFNVMKEEVTMFQELGAEGIVIGILKKDGNLDILRMEQLIKEAGNMSVTLHRAFDVCKNPFQVLSEAKTLGINTILTSGQKNNCIEGKALLAELVTKSEGDIDILVAGGVNAKVIQRLYPITKATSYHMSGKIIKESSMIYRKEGINMGLPSLSEYKILQTEVKQIKDANVILQRL